MSSESGTTSGYTPTLDTDRLPRQEGTISLAGVDDDPHPDEIIIDSVSTRRSDWLPEHLRESLSWGVEGCRKVAARHHPRPLYEQREGILGHHLTEYGVTAMGGERDTAGVVSGPVVGTYASPATKLLTHTGHLPREEWEDALERTGVDAHRHAHRDQSGGSLGDQHYRRRHRDRASSSHIAL